MSQSFDSSRLTNEGYAGTVPRASLPTRREQILLYATLKEEFRSNWFDGYARCVRRVIA